MNEPVELVLGRAESLVLFELVHRLDEQDVIDDPVERLALWRLEGALERTLVEPLQRDYRATVDRARALLARQAGSEDD